MGCVVMKYFGASMQLEIVIGQMHHFWDVHSENWTHSKWRYQRIEIPFARNIFNRLQAVKKNVAWPQVTKSPIDIASCRTNSWCVTSLNPFIDTGTRVKNECWKIHEKFYHQIHYCTQEQMHFLLLSRFKVLSLIVLGQLAVCISAWDDSWS